MKVLLAAVFISTFLDASYATSLVTRENVGKAVKGVTLKNFKPKVESQWQQNYADNLKQIAQETSDVFAKSFDVAVTAEIAQTPMPKPLAANAAIDILCAPFDQENESSEFVGAIQLVRCPLNDGYSYKKNGFGNYMDPLGPNDSSPEDQLAENPFSGPKLANGFLSMLSVSVNPPSPRLFKAWIMSELEVFAINTAQQKLVSVQPNGVTFDERLIQSYLQFAFIDRANKLLDEVEGDTNRRTDRLKFNVKTRAYPSGIRIDETTGRVSELNFALIFGGKNSFEIGPGTFRLGGVVIDRSPFASQIGSWAFPLQLYYYFSVLETYRDEVGGYGLGEFYIDLLGPIGTQWLAWGEVFAYPGNSQVRSIGYWRNILQY